LLWLASKLHSWLRKENVKFKASLGYVAKTLSQTRQNKTIKTNSQVLVAHVCNSRYSAGRVQKMEVQSQPGKQLERPYFEKIQHKKGLAKWLKWQSECLASVRP
jgi:hypothetical protein